MDKKFGLIEYLKDEGKILLSGPRFDFDSFPELGASLIQVIGATVKEMQQDADMHSWLIDFEDTPIMLKAEHYSESIWLEALNRVDDEEVITYLASLFNQGFDVSRETKS